MSRRLPRSVVSLRYWLQYDYVKNLLRSDDQGDVYGDVIHGAGSFLAVVGGLHVAVSIYLCYAFLRPLWRADRLGGGDPALRAQTRRVLIATFIAVISTLVCYLNPAIYFAQPLVLFAVDSIINDMALAVLALTDAAGDAEAARDASGLRVGVTDDSPGLELSDGAVLS